MNIAVAHILSLLALIAYGYASFGYARVLGPVSVGSGPGTPSRILRVVLLAGLLCHSLFVLVMDLSAAPLQRFPHTVSLVSFGLVGTFLLLERRLRIAALGAFIAPAALLFLLVSAVTFHVGMRETMPEEGGILLSLHLGFTVFSYVLLFVAGGASAALLLSESAIKRKRPLHGVEPLPPLIFLDRFHRVLVLTGAAALALGLLTGVLASNMLNLEPGKMYERLLWVLPEVGAYAVLLFLIYARGLRGRRVAWLTIIGVAVVFLSLVGAMNEGGGFHGF